MRLLLSLFLLVIAATFVATPDAVAQTGPSCQTNSPPTIEVIDPPSSPPWRFVTIYGCNLFAPYPSECTVTFGGLRALVFAPASYNEIGSFCSGKMTVLIPPPADSGPVIITIGGVSSAPFPYTIGPLDVEIIPGSIVVGVAEGTDFTAIANEMGDSAENITHLFCYTYCWYGVRVPDGTEMAKSRQYWLHAAVVWASPDQVVGALSGVVGIPIQVLSPVELPGTGGPPWAVARGSGQALVALGLAVGLIGWLFSRRTRSIS